ncbi:MAG: hypothetical protein WD294_16155 [Phycisphaeraceae bacterium]
MATPFPPQSSAHHDARSPRLLTLFMAALMLVAPSAIGFADEAPAEEEYQGRPLAEDRWLDNEYGVSLRLPVGVRTVRRTGDSYQLRAADEEDMFAMGVVVKQSRRELRMTDVMAQAKTQVAGVHRTTELLEEYAMEVGGVDIGVVMFRLPDTEQDDAFFGQALVQIDPSTFAIIEISSSWGDADVVRPTFEAMIKTLELQGIDDLEEQRRKELERTQTWRRDLGITALHDALVEEQLFRIVEDGNDIGYMRMLQEQTEQNGKSGITVRVQSRVMISTFNIDSQAIFFASDDDTTELWEVRTTQRPQRGNGEEQTTVETGIRTGADIVVSHDRPLGSKRKELTRPPMGYVPLAETWVLPQVLPNDRPGTYGFYSYNPNEGGVTYRTEQVSPLLDGYTINSRLTPGGPELKATFDADRTMREKQLGPDRKLIPTTAQHINQLWRNR